MARLFTSGFEVNVSTSDYNAPDGSFKSGGVSLDTTQVKSGVYSLKCTGSAYVYFSFSGYSQTDYWIRFAFRVSGLPTSTKDLFLLTWAVAGGFCQVRINTSGNLEIHEGGTTNVKATSSNAISADTWYVVQINLDTRVTQEGCTVLVDGTEWVTYSGNDLTANDITSATETRFQVGGTTAGGVDVWFDDFAVNDSSGANENSYPSQTGKVVLLKPISDAQDGSWTGGAGGTGIDLSAAVDNIPPAGTATETDTTQIESADSSGDNATDEYRANLTTYTTAGIGASDTINLIHAFINHGEDVTTNTKTGSFGGQSNPSWTYDPFTFGDNVGALGTWPTNWKWTIGTPQYAPSVTLGSSPVMAVRKTDTGTRVASVDFMGYYVDYTPAAAAASLLLRNRNRSPLLRM